MSGDQGTEAPIHEPVRPDADGDIVKGLMNTEIGMDKDEDPRVQVEVEGAGEGLEARVPMMRRRPEEPIGEEKGHIN